MAGQPMNRLAVHDDGAGGGLVKAANTIKYRGLASPIRADNGKNLVRLYVELNVVDRQQAAEPHRQTRHFKQYFAHAFNSTCGRLTGSKPYGRHIILTTMTKPKNKIRHSANQPHTPA